MIVQSYGFEPGVARRLNVESRFTKEVAPSLRANAGDNQTAVVIITERDEDSNRDNKGRHNPEA